MLLSALALASAIAWLVWSSRRGPSVVAPAPVPSTTETPLPSPSPSLTPPPATPIPTPTRSARTKPAPTQVPVEHKDEGFVTVISEFPVDVWLDGVAWKKGTLARHPVRVGPHVVRVGSTKPGYPAERTIRVLRDQEIVIVAEDFGTLREGP